MGELAQFTFHDLLDAHSELRRERADRIGARPRTDGKHDGAGFKPAAVRPSRPDRKWPRPFATPRRDGQCGAADRHVTPPKVGRSSEPSVYATIGCRG